MSVKKKYEFYMKIDGENQMVEMKHLKKILKEIINDDLDNVQFEQWWKLYDKKRAKVKVKKIFNRVINSKNVGELMEHTKQYVKSTPEIQYRKDPSTYLNQESWNDVVIIKTNPEDEALKEAEIAEKRYLHKQRMKLKQYSDDNNDYASPKEVADILKNMRFNK
tara:strand:+ start:397 stop:888 length:492 start_codon:yes stop_codon:yes gene_type:complete